MDNRRAAALMVLAMALFALEDMFVKLLSARMPVGQIIAAMGVMGFSIFWLLLRRQGGRFWTRHLLSRPVVIRTLGELVGSVGFVLAIALTEISSASAILQALPLVIVLGAALFLDEVIGWRRWLAIVAGFGGVLLVVKPGTAGFEPLSVLAVLGVLGLAVRDLATRLVPAEIPSNQLSALAWAVFLPAGLILDAVTGAEPALPGPGQAAMLVGAMAFGAAGYATLVQATRTGDAAAVAPFRYSRLVFALVVGMAVFGERPDLTTLLGAAIIAGAGAFSMWREMRLRRRPGPALTAGPDALAAVSPVRRAGRRR